MRRALYIFRACSRPTPSAWRARKALCLDTGILIATLVILALTPQRAHSAPSDNDSISAVIDFTEISVCTSIVQPVALPGEKRRGGVYWSIHTNMLGDVLLIPNIGAEAYLGKNISIAANYWNAWWDKKSANRFWRTYGMFLAARYWLGKAAHAKPLTGHHIGIYAQALLYDFEFGGKGYLSGFPGKNIFHHPTLAAGVEYGYSLPIARKLNLDFTIGVGYLQGRYQEYEPSDDCYLWRATRNKRWFGPTKLEVSLVWLLGADNHN